MKRLLAVVCVVTCICLSARSDYSDVQLDVMKCSPPKFMLVSDVDLKAQSLTGLLTIERQAPDSVVSAFHRTFKLSDIKVTNVRSEAIGENEIGKLRGKLVVVSEGKAPLSAAFAGLFREDTVVITVGTSNE